LVPSQGGVFEVSFNGKPVYSKIETGKFPDEAALLKEMDSYF